MRLVINQNQVGKFNFGGDDTSLAFSLRFTDDAGNTVKVTDEGLLPPEDYEGRTHTAVFSMPSHSDDDPEMWGDTYKDLFDDLDFESLLEHHMSRTGWTTGFSYEAQRTMFVVLLDRYFDDIVEGINQAENNRRELEIERLEERLRILRNVDDIEVPPKPDLKGMVLKQLDEEIEKYKRWRDEYAKGNDSWIAHDKRLKEARKKKANLKRELQTS